MKRILVIEDEYKLRDSIAEILELEGYSAIQAENGFVGVEKAKTENPDLILCDIMMPEMDGFKVLSILRNDTNFTFIPFIFISALSERKYQREGIEQGADDFIIKPFSREELLNAIDIKLQKGKAFKEESERYTNELRKNIVKSLPHQLQTPLNAVLGFSKIIRDNAQTLTNTEIVEMADFVHRSGTDLFAIIQKYLLYIDMEIVPKKRKFCYFDNYTSIVVTIVNSLSEKYDRKNDVQVDLQNALLNMELALFKFVITELLDNAFKYSEPGTSINLSAKISKQKLHFSIKDDGRGFTPNLSSKINAFIQFGRDIYEQQGIGLGLYLSKRIIEQFSGSFDIYSTPNEGTRVSFCLPLANAQNGHLAESQ